jgi:ABC-2 type transport system permease protein
MTADLWTVIWKEWREYAPRTGSSRGGLIGVLFMPFLFGVILPSQRGQEWLTAWPVLILAVLIPTTQVAAVVADAFAGERERHTLETLLASRLSDRAILFGKLGAAIAYGWVIALFALLLGAVTVNVQHSVGGLRFYNADIAFGACLLSLLMATLAGGAGVLISLKAATVRQAQQLISLIVVIPTLAPTFALNLLSDGERRDLLRALSNTSLSQVVLMIAAALLVLDAALIGAAMTRFRRSRLVLLGS